MKKWKFASILVAVSFLLATLALSQSNSGGQKVITSPRMGAPNLMALMQTQIDDLSRQIAALRADLVKTKDDLKRTKDDLKIFEDRTKIELAPPKGYTTMYIRKDGFNNVDSTALMKFFVKY